MSAMFRALVLSIIFASSGCYPRGYYELVVFAPDQPYQVEVHDGPDFRLITVKLTDKPILFVYEGRYPNLSGMREIPGRMVRVGNAYGLEWRSTSDPQQWDIVLSRVDGRITSNQIHIMRMPQVDDRAFMAALGAMNISVKFKKIPPG